MPVEIVEGKKDARKKEYDSEFGTPVLSKKGMIMNDMNCIMIILISRSLENQG